VKLHMKAVLQSSFALGIIVCYDCEAAYDGRTPKLVCSGDDSVLRL